MSMWRDTQHRRARYQRGLVQRRWKLFLALFGLIQEWTSMQWIGWRPIWNLMCNFASRITWPSWRFIQGKTWLLYLQCWKVDEIWIIISTQISSAFQHCKWITLLDWAKILINWPEIYGSGQVGCTESWTLWFLGKNFVLPWYMRRRDKWSWIFHWSNTQRRYHP